MGLNIGHYSIVHKVHLMSDLPTIVKNSLAHQKIVENHFASVSPFFMDFCRPTSLSTFTMGDEDNLAQLLTAHLPATYSVVLTHNNDLIALVQEIESDIVMTAQWTKQEAKTGDTAYVAVWSHPQAEHSLIGVASNFSRNQSISLTHPHIVLSSGATQGCVDDVFDGVEYHLMQYTPMSNDVLTLLGGIGWQHHDPISRMEHLVEQWGFEGAFGEHRSRSLVVRSVEVWADEQRAKQKQRLAEHIDHETPSLQRKKVL